MNKTFLVTFFIVIFFMFICIFVFKHKISFPQLSEIKQNEQIAIISTDMGDIKIRFFPEYAPKAVENFVTHAKDGYYNNTIFHRVINNFMIQGGDPL